MKTFLTAYWRHLVNLTYQVEAERLQPHVPAGLELDFWQGRAHVSLLAFEFLQTKVKGLKIPFHANFPEINLRFYVRRHRQRGVVFLREFVPKYCIALAANRLYNESYGVAPMRCETRLFDDRLHLRHLLVKNNENFNIDIQTEIISFVPAEASIEHHFKEHALGFGRTRAGNTLYYRVEHPVWEIFPVKEYHLHLDFGKLYGEAWAFLNGQQPICVLVAKGSAIKVYHPQKLENLDHES